jgi:hypothetical protein
MPMNVKQTEAFFVVQDSERESVCVRERERESVRRAMSVEIKRLLYSQTLW